MIANQNYGVALHILSYLAVKEDTYVTSTQLASSIDTNPVVIRRLLKILANAGLVETKRGQFGSKLKKDPSEITLYDVYKLFHSGIIMGPEHVPNVECTTGLKIISAVTNILSDSTNIFENELKKYTIEIVKKEIERG